MKPKFRAGPNMAMKVPSHEYAATVAFYRDVLGWPTIDAPADSSTESVRFAFGDKVLWIDRVAGMSQAEIWLEIITDNHDEAAAFLFQHGCARRDEIEPLTEDVTGFWVSSPCNIIHLVTADRTGDDRRHEASDPPL